MFLTVHAAAGLAIGKNINSVPLAFILGVVSHFILDIIPHGDRGLFNRLILFKNGVQRIFMIIFTDATLLAIFLLFVYVSSPQNQLAAITAGILGGIVPDLLNALSMIYKKNRLAKIYFRLHFFLHEELVDDNISFKKGLFVQFIFATVFLIIFIVQNNTL